MIFVVSDVAEALVNVVLPVTSSVVDKLAEVPENVPPVNEVPVIAPRLEIVA